MDTQARLWLVVHLWRRGVQQQANVSRLSAIFCDILRQHSPCVMDFRWDHRCSLDDDLCSPLAAEVQALVVLAFYQAREKVAAAGSQVTHVTPWGMGGL